MQDDSRMKALAEQEMRSQEKGQPIAHPILVVLCGKSADIRKSVSELLLPEYEGMHIMMYNT